MQTAIYLFFLSNNLLMDSAPEYILNNLYFMCTIPDEHTRL